MNDLSNLSFEVRLELFFERAVQAWLLLKDEAGLVAAFYEPKEGKIFIDGHDTRYCSFKSIRKSIGIVQQDIELFNDSLRSNLEAGKKDADDEETNQEDQPSSGSGGGGENASSSDKQKEKKKGTLLLDENAEEQPLGSKAYDLINKGYIRETTPW